MKDQTPVFKEIPIGLIEEDVDQPRKNHGKESINDRLYGSINKFGIQQAIVTNETSNGRYRIIDGHRRYRFAQRLGLKTVPCRVYKNLSEGEFVSLQYEIQNVRKDWKPFERASELARIRKGMSFRTNKELAEHLGLSQTVVSSSLAMIEQSIKYMEMMSEYDLSQSYRVEFIRLKPKLRKVKEIEISEIIEILFKKVSFDVINNAKDFRKLRKIFLRKGVNEEQLYDFLTDEDMTVDELEKRTAQSKIALLVDNLLEELGKQLQTGNKFSEEKEVMACLKVRNVLLDTFPIKKYPLGKN